MKKHLTVIAMLLAVLLLAVGCAGNTAAPAAETEAPVADAPAAAAPVEEQEPEPVIENAERYGGDLQISTTSVGTTMDPHLSNGLLGNYHWMTHVYETPLCASDTGVVYPLLCDYEFNMDTLELTLKMLPDRFFSDGTQVTIDDVVASIARAGANYGNFAKAFTDILVDTKVEGDQVTYTFSSFNPNTIIMLADMRGPVYVTPKALLDSLGADGTIDELSEVIGSGCYTLTKYEPDTVYELTKNPAYVPLENDATGPAGPRHAYLDTISIYVNTDMASVTAAMIAGDYQYGTILNDMAPFAEQVGLKRLTLKLEWTPAIFFNLSQEYNADSIVQNKDFRKAVRAALNCDAIMLAINNGMTDLYALEPSPMSTSSVYYNSIIKDTEYNVHDQALVDKYLEASGYNGEEIVWMCAQSSSFYTAAVVGIQQLVDAGINCRMELVDAGSHSSLRNSPDSGHDIGAWTSQKGTTVPTTVNSFINGTSSGWWENEDKARLLGIMRTTEAGSAESIAAYTEFCALIAEEVPWIAFGESYTSYFSSPDFEIAYKGIIAYYWDSYFTK